MHFEDVVDHGDQLPLPVDLFPAAQTEALEPDGVGDVAEDRFHRAQPLAIDRSPPVAVDLVFHLINQLLLPGFRAGLSAECDLSGRCLMVRSQAPAP